MKRAGSPIFASFPGLFRIFDVQRAHDEVFKLDALTYPGLFVANITNNLMFFREGINGCLENYAICDHT